MNPIIYQAIETRFLGPTNTKGSRVVAVSCGGSRLITDWDHAMDASENHIAAANRLAARLEWNGQMRTGTLKNSYVHVFIYDRGDK